MRRREAAVQHEVDRGLGQPLARDARRVDQAAPDHAEQEGRGDLEIEPPEVAVRHPLPEHPAQDLEDWSPPVAERRAEAVREARVVAGDQAQRLGVARERVDQRAHHQRQALGRRQRPRRHLLELQLQLLQHLAQHLEKQLLLGAEITVQGRLADPGRARHVIHLDGVVARGAEQPARRLEHALPAFHAP